MYIVLKVYIISIIYRYIYSVFFTWLIIGIVYI